MLPRWVMNRGARKTIPAVAPWDPQTSSAVPWGHDAVMSHAEADRQEKQSRERVISGAHPSRFLMGKWEKFAKCQ
jgi:hypothetical protein